ncbi:unnamed protein product [Cuscuta campestris]|uniref:Exonuclease V, chloroplastic n=1 Tax=Cuscuta campestris TaxID=132261 RepID=A0A484N5N0_9ASTE|nr:unnamed protein product [Cuscuta campestris]
MSESPTQSAIKPDTTPCPSPRPHIPVEIISDEEMALIDAALAAACPSISCSTQLQRGVRSIHSITLLSKRRVSGCTESGSSPTRDIEDGGNRIVSPRKKNRLKESLLQRFRRKRGLAVTDITATTLSDLVRYFRNTCSMLPQAHNQLLLRYELQGGETLLGEDEFGHDSNWVNDQIRSCLEFWRGDREASCAPMEERWKCKSCSFASVCPASSSSSPTS